MNSTPLSPAAERIALLALEQFAEHGYDAASLNDIAVRVGIKKASLYAHFASKDALYEVTLELALRAELNYVDAQFIEFKQSNTSPGELYIRNLRYRFSSSESLRFLLRAAFYPPQTHRERVMSGFNNYLACMRSRFLAALHTCYPALSGQIGELLAETYMAVIDSLNVELIYGNEKAYDRRLNALQQLSQADVINALTGREGE
ncbi:TetR/AcrR family transcriptional regulator [Pseudomonas sp. NPDC087817]|uniref:TetR/AcrR family transcriptional regulator n=1 Tax=Pseudomonas sp. NPDC087817 TaxID=3364451 RepID=UPI003818C798